MIRKITAFLFLSACCLPTVSGQAWIDTAFNIQIEESIHYGSAIDFAGNERRLLMDVAMPVDDIPPPCGRPLLVVIHGGGFLSGSRSEGLPYALMRDFAKRGYVAASIDYRLGMFHTDRYVHCNLPDWDCLNMADSTEWSRAYFRAVQDAKGAIRYLVHHAEDYGVDPRHVFVAGVSAGGFVALGAAFLDDPAEVPVGTGPLPELPPPNLLYEGPCIQELQLDTSVASMNLQRPGLGPLQGSLFAKDTLFTIRGVGSFYGGMFGNLFERSHDGVPPVLYLFHQPNDLVVPYTYGQAYEGLSDCAMNFGGGCQAIINRPEVYGSAGMAALLADLQAAGQPMPSWELETTNNSADCLQQFINPETSGHSLDNYWLRTANMAELFATRIDTAGNCTVGLHPLRAALELRVFPNPATSWLRLSGEFLSNASSAHLLDMLGREVGRWEGAALNSRLDLPAAPAGLYFLIVKTRRALWAGKVQLQGKGR